MSWYSEIGKEKARWMLQVDKVMWCSELVRTALPSRVLKDALFMEAINSDSNYMQIYFPLTKQFITQAEPAFCGLATLAMCLNALQIDPGRMWKGPWRWYSKELFDCCASLSVVKENGISMSEFIYQAICNGLYLPLLIMSIVTLRVDDPSFSIPEDPSHIRITIIIVQQNGTFEGVAHALVELQMPENGVAFCTRISGRFGDASTFGF